MSVITEAEHKALASNAVECEAVLAAMNWNPVALRAYIAGLVDGDGTIGIKRRLPTSANHSVSPKYSAHIGVAMTNRDPVALVAAFCGATDKISSRSRKEGYKTIYEFSVENERARKLLTEIYPYLVGKREQAQIALQLAVLRKEGRQHRTKVSSTLTFKGGRSAGATYHVRALSDDYVAKCDALYQASLVRSPRSGQPGRFGSRACL